MISKTSEGLTPFTADLHMHSALSGCADNNMVPDKVVEKMHELGIEIFSLTDHNAGFNCRAFANAAKKKDILFIPGIELQSSEEIHLLGYYPDVDKLESFCEDIVKPGLMKGMKNNPQIFGSQVKFDIHGKTIGEDDSMLSMPLSYSIDELVVHIHSFDGIAVASHLDRDFSIISQLGFIPEGLELDAVEIKEVGKIEDIRLKYLANTGLNVISSSDCHHIDLMKEPKMTLWLESLDVKNCLDCIKGDGPGKISIKRKAGKTKKPRNSGSGENKDGSRKDWKNLYG